MFWLFLYRLWPRCLDAVVIVKPETVIAWHHKGFRAFWAWKSRPRRRGRPPVPAEVRARELKGENVTCPWHATVFNIKSGEALAGPGTEPVPIYKVRVEGDDIQIAKT